MPLFSVITITKNNAIGFARTEKSLKAQTFTDYEWVVIDGDVEPDNGIYDAMNKGLARATGDYVMFMNAGDCVASSDILAIIAQHCPADFIYGDAFEGGYRKPARSHTRIHHGMFTHHQAMVYRRDMIADMRYDEAYPIAADYKFTLKYLGRCKNIIHIPQVICEFEVGGISQSRSKQGRIEQSHIRRECGIEDAWTIRLRQIFAQWIRTLSPPLYGYIRSKI